ncbi:acyl-CoA dehydrogenase family protein [Blastococcus sp. TF02A-26]|uniref:acyl-CoA dehydrogenase family protein n=1 Tax=Blastococcus sp. TF02A-26 TaxID=2250577 RepID=UPI000DEB29C6|nr:acyl-CoA dehydrogenase family protein [Blastococcus sp. TF02A-26]RBY83176.1 acyl-CoA dehydrogenase [Blastococcus sp. TF02A-26]
MDLSTVELTPEQQAFQQEVRAFLDEIVTEEVHEHERRTGDGFNEGVHLALGSRGWLFPAWPVSDGGAGLDRVCQRILALELSRREVPMVTHSTTGLVWSAVELSADPELAARLKPEVAAGRVRFCLGYSDPEGGSDIAGATLRAVRDGDEWVLNGSKLWTTGAHNCQYTFLITRTDPEAPKHKGLTMFLVPLDSPGVEIQAIRTYGGERTNAVYYTDVHVSDTYRMGDVNAGWATLQGPLSAEHGAGRPDDGLSDIGMTMGTREFEAAIDAAARWAKRTTRPDGTLVADDPAFLDRLGHLVVETEAIRVTPGPMGRNKSSLSYIAGIAELIDMVGPEALLAHGSEGAIEDGVIDYAHRFAQGTATYGGTTEVFKGMIAQHVLGLPRLNLPGSKAWVR